MNTQNSTFVKTQNSTFVKTQTLAAQDLKTQTLAAQDLSIYKVEIETRKHQFWKRDALPIELYSNTVFEQKLDYIHTNPVKEKWNLADKPSSYKYSSAKFYETGIDEFGFLKHYSEWQ